jgi:hypothetical protein
MGDIRQYNNPISLQSFEQGERRHRRSGDVWRFLIQKDWLLFRVGLKIGKADAMGRRINAEWVLLRHTRMYSERFPMAIFVCTGCI